MALPEVHPLNEAIVYANAVNCSSTSLAYARAPFRGKVLKVFSVIGSVLSTADATVTTSINGTAITTGVLTITQSGSAAGDVDTALPTAANNVNEDDYIGFVFSGTGTAGGPVQVGAVIRRA